MIIYRLAKSHLAADLSGTGGLMAEGRWSRKGFRVFYTSQSQALCFAELSVRLPISVAPVPYSIVHLEVPDGLIEEAFSPDPLPMDWKCFPYSKSTLELGTRFLLDARSLIMRVPSAIVPDEANFILNPLHVDFQQVVIRAIEPFPIDERHYNR